MVDLLEWVDKLDGGGISREEYLSDQPEVWLGRVIDVGEGTALTVLEYLQEGFSVEEILTSSEISGRVEAQRKRRILLSGAIQENMRIEDRLAIVRLEGIGMRSNGYHVTAMAGERCDACIVIHGDVGASFGEKDRYPVSASFYTNSFLHDNGGIFDLTTLATRFDPDGGGHANACGCRIKPLKGLEVEDRIVSLEDVELNISAWLEMWSERDS